MYMTNQDTDTAIYFDAVAELGKLLGLSKSASLALALLFVSATPLSLDEIAQQTGIAKSSISVILKTLEQMGLTTTVDKPTDRRKYYRVVDNPGDALALVVARRLENLTAHRETLLEPEPAMASPENGRFEQIKTIYKGLAHLSELFRAQRADAWENLDEQLMFIVNQDVTHG
jgi:DNA-binding transcriptional regulator GbsR (MarR family)